MGKVNQWYKLKQRDMLHSGEDLPPMETITMEQYQQTGEMSDQDYMDTANEEMKRANKKYEGKEKGEAETLMEEKEREIKKESSAVFYGYNKDPDLIPIMINKAALVENSIVTTEMRDRFADRGQFCCRVPGTWEADENKEHILMIPLDHVFEADEGRSYIAFMDKKHLPFVLKAGDGTPATEYFGMRTQEFVNQFFQEAEASVLPERVIDAAKSLAETVSVHLKQPAPPIKVR